MILKVKPELIKGVSQVPLCEEHPGRGTVPAKTRQEHAPSISERTRIIVIIVQ